MEGAKSGLPVLFEDCSMSDMTTLPAPDLSFKEAIHAAANRQRIAQPKSPVSRQCIAYLNGRENRHFRRGKCRLHMPISPYAGHSKIAVLRKSLVAPPMNGLENQDFLGVAIVGLGDRVLVDQSSERLPVCHQRQSEPQGLRTTFSCVFEGF